MRKLEALRVNGCARVFVLFVSEANENAGAAIQTLGGNVYTGICVDTASTLGICAERNAIFNMLTDGENEIAKIVCVLDGKCGAPCGACRELLAQICGKRSSQVEILMDIDTMRVATLKELCPEWWLEIS